MFAGVSFHVSLWDFWLFSSSFESIPASSALGLSVHTADSSNSPSHPNLTSSRSSAKALEPVDFCS